MFAPIAPSSRVPFVSYPDEPATTAAPAPEPAGILRDLRTAPAADRPVLARDLVDGMDDDTLSALANADNGPAALAALDDALADAPATLDVSAQRARVAQAQLARDDDDKPAGTTNGANGVTATTAHIEGNTVTWTDDAQGRPIRAEADLTDVFPDIDRSPDETQAQKESADRGVDGDQGGHVIGHRFVKDQGLKNLFPQNGNFNMGAYKTLENEWADWIDSGKDVHIVVQLTPKNQDRPDHVRVSYQVIDPSNGRVVYDQRVTFANEAGQHYDRVSKHDIDTQYA